MTNKEALSGSLNKFKSEELRDPETNEIIQEEREMLPIALAEFVNNIAALSIGIVDQMLNIDYPDVTFGIQKEKGKAKKNKTAFDYINVLIGNDLLRHTGFFMQMQGFLDWWLEQNADLEDREEMWYDFKPICEKWNEYAKIMKQ